jgi:hypothetical protein
MFLYLNKVYAIVSDIKGKIGAKNIRPYGAEADTWSKGRGSNRRIMENA